MSQVPVGPMPIVEPFVTSAIERTRAAAVCWRASVSAFSVRSSALRAEVANRPAARQRPTRCDLMELVFLFCVAHRLGRWSRVARARPEHF